MEEQKEVNEKAVICKVQNCNNKIVGLDRNNKIKVCSRFRQLFLSSIDIECTKDIKDQRTEFERIQRVFGEMKVHAEEHKIDDVFQEYTTDIQFLEYLLNQIESRYSDAEIKISQDESAAKKEIMKLQQEIDKVQTKYQLKLMSFQGSVHIVEEDSQMQNFCFENDSMLNDFQNLLLCESKEENPICINNSKTLFEIDKEEFKETNKNDIKNEARDKIIENISQNQQILSSNYSLMIKNENGSFEHVNTSYKTLKEIKKEINTNSCNNRQLRNSKTEVNKKSIKEITVQHLSKIGKIAKSKNIFWIAILVISIFILNDKVKSLSLIRSLNQELKSFKDMQLCGLYCSQEYCDTKIEDFYLKYYDRNTLSREPKGENFTFNANLETKEGKYKLDELYFAKLESIKGIQLYYIQNNYKNLARFLVTSPSMNFIQFSGKYDNKIIISYYMNGLKIALRNISDYVEIGESIFNREDMESLVIASSNSTTIRFIECSIEFDRVPDFSGPQYRVESFEFIDSKPCDRRTNKITDFLRIIKAMSDSTMKNSLKKFKYRICGVTKREIEDAIKDNGIVQIEILSI